MKYLFILLGCIGSYSAYAIEIASCSNPAGKSYFPEFAMVNKDNAGWKDDKITGGITKLSKFGKEDFDILYVDVTNRITSSKEAGATILVLNKGKNFISILVYYPETTSEIYTFIKNPSGKIEYTHILNRIGDTVMFPKSSLMVGECSIFNVELL
jgi:hypothetical protein